ASSLDKLPSCVNHKIEPRNLLSPRREGAPDLSTDARFLSRQRFVLLGIHDHLVNLFRRSAERHDLPNGRGVALLYDLHDVLLSCSIETAHCSWSRAR